MINVRFKKFESLAQKGAGEYAKRSLVPYQPSNFTEHGVPRVNIVTRYDKKGRAKEAIRGLNGDTDSISKNRNPKATIWRVYKVLVNSQHATASEIARRLRVSKDRVTHAVRDLRRAKNGSINIVFEDGKYRLAA